MIAVYIPEQIDQVLGCDLAPDESKIPGTEVTLREAYPLMCPEPGRAWIYVSDMSFDYPEEVMYKTAELFQKHGVGEIWTAILRDGQERLNEVIKMHLGD